MNSQEFQISQQAEEYLEAIYRLEMKNNLAKTTQLSKKLNVVPGSITNTIESLEKRGYVIHIPYKGVKLTEKGRKIAASIIRKHRLAERLLTDFIHIKWSNVHEAACKLEHALSPEILNCLETALGNPERCPHGNPIPKENGEIIEEESMALTELEPGDQAIFLKILEEDQTTLRLLERVPLSPHSIIKVKSNKFEKEQVIISIDGISYKLDQKVATLLYVKPIKTDRGKNK